MSAPPVRDPEKAIGAALTALWKVCEHRGKVEAETACADCSTEILRSLVRGVVGPVNRHHEMCDQTLNARIAHMQAALTASEASMRYLTEALGEIASMTHFMILSLDGLRCGHCIACAALDEAYRMVPHDNGGA